MGVWFSSMAKVTEETASPDDKDGDPFKGCCSPREQFKHRPMLKGVQLVYSLPALWQGQWLEQLLQQEHRQQGLSAGLPCLELVEPEEEENESWAEEWSRADGDEAVRGFVRSCQGREVTIFRQMEVIYQKKSLYFNHKE